MPFQLQSRLSLVDAFRLIDMITYYWSSAGALR